MNEAIEIISKNKHGRHLPLVDECILTLVHVQPKVLEIDAVHTK